MNIGMVCKRFSKGWYTRYLCEALSKKLSNNKLIFYSPINLDIKDIPYDIIIKKTWNAINFPFKLFRKALLDRLDIIHIQFEFNILGSLWSSPLVFLALLMLKILRTKVILTFHGPSFSNEIEFKKDIKYLAPKGFKKFNFLLKIYLILSYFLIDKLSQIIIMHSESSKYYLIKCGINPVKIHVIPHGISPYDKSFIKLNIYETYSIPRSMNIILYFGVLSPRKGVEYLIQSFSIIHKLNYNYILVIVGKDQNYYGNYKQELQSLAYELELEKKVIFTGYIEESELKTFLSLATIVVFPYIISNSASGTLSRAIEFGKPVIATNIGHFLDVLKNDYNSLLVEPKNSNELAEAMLVLINNESVRQKISMNIINMQEIYSWDKVADMTIEAYHSCTRSLLFRKNNGNK